MNRNSILVIIALTGAIAGCSSGHKQPADAALQPHRTFAPPPVPIMLTTQENQSAYLAAHYWDSLSFADTAFIRRSTNFEQHFVNYLSLLPTLAPAQIMQEIDTLLGQALRADTLVFARLTELFDRYCYNPNSPIRNEELYVSALKSILALPSVSDAHKIRLNFRLEMALKNCVGEAASDFTYTLADGRRSRLSGIRTHYTLLFFNNPDCEECKRLKDLMQHSACLNRLMSNTRSGQKILTVLSVYSDKELDAWRRTVYPKQWINAYDAEQSIDKNRLYDLKAIPCLYLLDRQKRVVLKDATWEQIEQRLGSIPLTSDANDGST